MTWEYASIIIAAFISATVAFLKFVPQRRGGGMDIEQRMEPTPSLDAKVEEVRENVCQIESDIGELKTDVEVLKNNSKRSESDIERLIKKVEAMDERLTNYLLKESRSQHKP